MKRIEDYISYCPDTGAFFWKKRAARCVNVGDVAGHKRPDGYVTIRFQNQNIFAQKIAWRLFYGIWPDGQVDHINGERADNRIQNLRLATNQQNQANANVRKDSKTGVRGVTHFREKYRAKLVYNGKCISLGLHKTIEEAEVAYNKEAARLFGSYALCKR